MVGFNKILNILKESPKFNDEERLSYFTIFKISKNAFNRAYDIVSDIKDGYKLVIKKETGQYFVITEIHNEIVAILKVDVRKTPFPVIPKYLDNPIQVSMVKIADGFQEERITKISYIAIAKIKDLVSDYEQYEASKNLWKSLARTNEINIYVYNGKTKDYIKDHGGKITKYNSANIEDEQIWKNSNEYKKILLVATIKNF